MERLTRYLNSGTEGEDSSKSKRSGAMNLGTLENAAIPVDAPLIPDTMFPTLPDLTDRLTTSKRHDLFLDGRKISGSAMKLGSDVAYHHYTLLVSSDRSQIGRYLSPKSRVSEIKQGKASLTRGLDLNGFAQVDCVGVGSVPSPVTTLHLAGWFNGAVSSDKKMTADQIAFRTMMDVGADLVHQNVSDPTASTDGSQQEAAPAPSTHVLPLDLPSQEPTIWADIAKQREEWKKPAWLFRCSGYTTYLDLGANHPQPELQGKQVKTHIERGGVTKVGLVTPNSTDMPEEEKKKDDPTSVLLDQCLNGTSPFLDDVLLDQSGNVSPALQAVRDDVLQKSRSTAGGRHPDAEAAVKAVLESWWHAHRPRGLPRA